MEAYPRRGDAVAKGEKSVLKWERAYDKVETHVRETCSNDTRDCLLPMGKAGPSTGDAIVCIDCCILKSSKVAAPRAMEMQGPKAQAVGKSTNWDAVAKGEKAGFWLRHESACP